MPGSLRLKHGTVSLPSFFPDATYGSVRCADAADLALCGVPGLVMNAYHLASKPGASVIRRFGGLHRFSGWDGPILTDSGGFQVFSLIRQNPKYGEIRRNELIFRPENSEKIILTPEKSIQFQFACGSDAMVCLDCCTHPEDPASVNEEAVEATAAWAKRCRREYERQIEQRKLPQGQRPLLFAVIQGGGSFELRRQCAGALTAIGFDGYGFGGWPADGGGELTENMLRFTAGLMPDGAVKYAMGIGKPEGIALCAGMGYGLFDCVIPTREARHNRLYVFKDDTTAEYGFHYIADEGHIRGDRPVSEHCACPLCARYSAAYLHHLLKTGDSLACRLATLHNLSFYAELMQRIKGKSADGA